MTPAAAALDWIERGNFIVAIPAGRKAPITKGWTEQRLTQSDVPTHFPGGPQNIGVLLGVPYGDADIDLDCPEAIAAAAILAPDTGLKFGRPSKRASHHFYRCDPPRPGKKYLDPTNKTCVCELRCLKSDGRVGLQTVVPPSVHPSGERIQFEPGFDRQPANIDADELAQAVARIAAAALLAKHWPAAGHGRHECELALAGCLARAGWSIDAAEQFVLATYRAVPSHDRTKLDRVRASVLSSFAKKGSDQPTTGYTTLAAAVGAPVAKAAMVWLGITADAGRAAAGAGAGAASAGAVGAGAAGAAGAGAPAAAPNLLAELHRDYGNGRRLIAMYGGDLRYSYDFKKWLCFDRTRWQVDERGHARELAQLTAVEFLRQAVAGGNEVAQKFAKESLDSKRITNMLLEAQSGLSISAVDLDTHPYLLNFKNGTVDLRDGCLHPHDRRQFITKLVKYDYRPEATCPTFLSFLARIMGVCPDASEAQLQRGERLIDYLQKAFGYTLTGVTIEKAVFLLHGAGDNGKSTLLALFLELLDEYAVLLQIDSLMVRQESNNTQADLADLRGARFVMTSETEEGQRLAEGKLKRITQGMGRIKAVRKYENPIEFDESHKLWLDANHLPQVRGTDNAIWNRLHPIPFSVTIPKAEQDRDLRTKLLAEAQGVLAWAVAGAVRWYREGLGKPPEVEQAGAAWRTDSDQTSRFLDTCCVVGELASVLSRALYQAYRKWAEQVGERAQRETDFRKHLGELKFTSRHTENGTVYDGVGLLPS
jgi:putative DNA primase/helicase